MTKRIEDLGDFVNNNGGENNPPFDLYFIILKDLYKKSGINIERNITPILSKYFKNFTIADVYWDLKSEDFTKFLKSMEDAGHISFEIKTTPPKEGFPKGESLAFAKLKPSGYLFYREYRVVYWNKIRSWIAISIAVLSACFSAKQFFKSEDFLTPKYDVSQQKSNSKHQQIQSSKKVKIDKSN